MWGQGQGQGLHFVDSNHPCSLGNVLWLDYLSLLQIDEKLNFLPLTMVGNEKLLLKMEERQVT